MLRRFTQPRHVPQPWRLSLLCSSIAAIGMTQSALATVPGRVSVTVPVVKSGPIATTFEQLRVNAVADQLINYLDGAIQWVDKPEHNLPLASIAPKVRAAVLAHPEVRLSQAKRSTAAFATREAYAGFLPKVSANLETGTRNNAAVDTPWNKSPAYEDTSKALALSANQLVYDFGALGYQVDALSAKERGAESESELKTSELALRASSAWVEMFRARQLQVLAEMNVRSRQQILSFIEEREQLGASAKSDVLRARARLADAQVSAAEALTQVATAEASYREIFNEAPPKSLAMLQLPAMNMARYADLDYLYGKSPQLAQAKAQTIAAQLEAKSAAAALRPAVYFDVTARRRDVDGPGVPGTDWSAGFVLRQTLYSGGADVARQQQAEQRAIEAQLEQDNVKRQLGRIYTQALADVNTSVAAVAARKEAAKVAAIALEAVREQFAFRRGSLLDLLRAQEELYVSGRQLIDGVVDESTARLRLLHLGMELGDLFNIPQAPLPISK